MRRTWCVCGVCVCVCVCVHVLGEEEREKDEQSHREEDDAEHDLESRAEHWSRAQLFQISPLSMNTIKDWKLRVCLFLCDREWGWCCGVSVCVDASLLEREVHVCGVL